MIIGGNRNKKGAVEILNVSPEGGICTEPMNLPDDQDLGNGAVGGYIDGKAVVCGGEEGGSLCHGYSFETQEWSELPYQTIEIRQEAAGIALGNGSLVIIGGKNPAGRSLPTSEILVEGKFLPSTMWPIAFWGHCIAQLNTTHAFVAGGRNNDDDEDIRAAYDFRLSEGYWTWVTDMNSGRSGHVCGKVEDARGNLAVVVAGGKGNLEVDVFYAGLGKWSEGPPLPHEMDRAAAVEVGGTFAVLGGLHPGDCPVRQSDCFSSRYIYEFGRLGMDEWKMREEYTMEIPRGRHVVVRIPKERKLCSCPTCPGLMACKDLCFLRKVQT